METFATRLQRSMDERKVIAAQLSRKAGVSAASVSDWVTDKTKAENVKAEPLLKAAAFLRVNPMWLLFGKGPKHGDTPSPLHAAEPRATYTASVAWPFDGVDPATIAALDQRSRDKLAGVLVAAALQLGLDIEKRSAA